MTFKPIWFHSIRGQLLIVLALIFVLLISSLGYAMYALRLRQHDYIILNLTGQLRVLSQNMLYQAKQYNDEAPDDYNKYNRDLTLYWAPLQEQKKTYKSIITGLSARQINQEMTGRHDAIYCNFDAFSRNQLAISDRDWRRFELSLDKAIGPNLNQPRLTFAAEYISKNAHLLVKSSEKLANAFQMMMEQRLDQIRFFLSLALISGVVLIIGALYAMQIGIVRPIKKTLKGFEQISKGDFSYQVPVHGKNEIAQMTIAFNLLASRLNAMFKLTDRINQGKQLDEMLRFVHEEFQQFVPLDWVGVLYATPDETHISLERFYSPSIHQIKDGKSFIIPSHFYDSQQNTMLIDLNEAQPDLSLAQSLAQSGLKYAVYLSLLGLSGVPALMVFAAQKKTYEPAHIEFLNNIGATMSHVLEKTVVMESLVAAALQGLAKLAESRDPETGDHLKRMALYSAIVAEKLNEHPNYLGKISPAYVRDVYQFAPMHDIGKVGISDSILLKPSSLSELERLEMQRHPTIGGEVLRQAEAQVETMGFSIFSVGIEIAECHHEKFDGSGYPLGLKGSEIPLSARIVAAADVFDALTSKRPYKEAWSIERALSAMQNDAGKHFDPDIIEAINASLPRMLEVYNKFKHV